MSSYSEGQTHQLMDRLEAEGFTPADITALGQYPKLADIKKVLAGVSQIVAVKHIIDCDADPFVPENWKVESHKKQGKMEWDSEKITLYLCDEQKSGTIEGNKLQKKLESQKVLNANVLDYLLAHPELIPESWKGKYVFFWGTVYRNSDGDLCVRCLDWDGDRWRWDYYWLDDDWGGGNPAACSQVS